MIATELAENFPGIGQFSGNADANARGAPPRRAGRLKTGARPGSWHRRRDFRRSIPAPGIARSAGRERTSRVAPFRTVHGTPAQTIHSLIYRFSEATPEAIAREIGELAALERDLPRMGIAKRSFAETQIRRLKFRLDHIHEPRFVLNPQSALREADLLVLDKVSVVGTAMAQNLMTLGKPILVLVQGDPGRLDEDRLRQHRL